MHGQRKGEPPEHFPAMSEGGLAEIEWLNAEGMEYLRHHASKTVTAGTA